MDDSGPLLNLTPRRSQGRENRFWRPGPSALSVCLDASARVILAIGVAPRVVRVQHCGVSLQERERSAPAREIARSRRVCVKSAGGDNPARGATTVEFVLHSMTEHVRVSAAEQESRARRRRKRARGRQRVSFTAPPPGRGPRVVVVVVGASFQEIRLENVSVLLSHGGGREVGAQLLLLLERRRAPGPFRQ